MPFWSRNTHPSFSARRASVFWAADGQQWAVKTTANDDTQWIPRNGGGARELRKTAQGYAEAYETSVWAFRCATIRAQQISSLLNRARVSQRATNQVLDDNPVREALDRSYERYEQDYWEQVVLNYDLFGEVFTQLVTASPDGLPMFRLPYALRVLPSLLVEPVIQRGRVTQYDCLVDDSYIALGPEEIAFDRTYRPSDTLRGLSLMAQVMDEVNVDLHVIRFDKNFFKNGARPGLIFSPKEGEFGDKDYQKLKAWLREKVAGLANAWKPFVLSRPADIATVQTPPLEDQTYLSDDMLNRICGAWGVPVGLVRFADQKYQLSTEQQKAFMENTVFPAVRHHARHFSVRVMPFLDRAQQYTFDVEPVLAEVMAMIEDQEKKDRIASGRFQSGGITFNEYRRAIGQQSEMGGDFYLFPPGHIVVQRTELARIADLVAPGQAQQVIELRTPPSLPSASTPAQLPASTSGDSALPTNVESDQGLNGAQITAALEILAGVTAGTTPPEVAIELLTALGIAAERVQRMVAATAGAKPSGPPVLPAGKSSFGTPEGTVVLYLTEVEDLLVLQQVLQRSLPPDARIRWTPREQLHITLVHAPLVDEGDFAGVFMEIEKDFAGLPVRVTGVSTFSSDTAVPVIALVEKTADLAHLQGVVYEKFSNQEIDTSEYSQPERWTPHITLGYAEPATAGSYPDALKMLGIDVECQAVRLAFTRGEYETIESITSPASKAAHLDAVDELRAWRKATLRRGPDRGLKFVCAHIPDDVQQFVRDGLEFASPDDRDDLAALFERAHRRLISIPGDARPALPDYPAGKAIQATRLDFESDFGDLLAAAGDGHIDRREWALRARTLLRKYGEKAYRDGLNDGGVPTGDDEPLDDDRRAEVNRLAADQSQYVTELGRVLFKTDRGVVAAQDSAKSEMWWNKSIHPFYQAARLSADKNGNYRWGHNPLKQNCQSCITASGQVHPLQEWHAANIIPNSTVLLCKGFLCGCKLTRTTDKVQGRLADIPLHDAVKTDGVKEEIDVMTGTLPAEIAQEFTRVLGRQIEGGQIAEENRDGLAIYSVVLREEPGYYATISDDDIRVGLDMISPRLQLNDHALLDEARLKISFTLKEPEHHD